MNKAEAMFRAFFEADAEYVLFYLAHRVQLESFTSPDTAKGDHEQWDEVRVFNDDSELAVFDDKPNLIRVCDNIAVAAYVRKAEGKPSRMCAAGSRYECHRPVKNWPAQMATLNNGTIVEQYWANGVRQLKRDVQLGRGVYRHRVGTSTPVRAASATGW